MIYLIVAAFCILLFRLIYIKLQFIFYIKYKDIKVDREDLYPKQKSYPKTKEHFKSLQNENNLAKWIYRFWHIYEILFSILIAFIIIYVIINFLRKI